MSITFLLYYIKDTLYILIPFIFNNGPRGGNALYINITMLLLLPLPPPYPHYRKPHPLAGPLCSLLGGGEVRTQRPPQEHQK